MDAKVRDQVITPRIGKPVEIAALWIAACSHLAAFAKALNEPSAPFGDAAALAIHSFDRYWNERGFLMDVIDGPSGDDAAVRPNQIIAAALPTTPLTQERRRTVVDCVSSLLLTSLGLRTLAPSDAAYRGRYAGDQPTRDIAYHNGTAWPWLIGAFVDAYLLANPGREAEAKRVLEPLVLHLRDAGLGSVSEVADGDPPHRPGGCPAQAWSVAELLRSWIRVTSPNRTSAR
jgi:glycogen debranching enzyme